MRSRSNPVAVCWVERAVDGTAAGQHLKGTLARLASLPNFEVVRVVADRTSEDGPESSVKKALRILSILSRTVVSARRGRVLVARHHPLLFPVVWWWRLLGGPVVLSVQGSLDDLANEYPGLGQSSWLRTLSVAATRRAHVLVAGAPVLLNHIRSEMAAPDVPVVTLPNGVFVEELATAGQSERPMTKPYAVFVGNLASWQGIDTMVEATERPEWPSGLELVVVGDGVERDLLRGHTRVRGTGRLPSSEAARWYAHAYCAISMKTTVGDVGAHGYWPFKLIESAAVGVPIVCSDARGMKEAGERLGNALIVPGGDSRACAEAVRKLFETPQLREELAARGRLNVSGFDWVAGADALGDALSTAIRRARKGR